MTLREWHMVKRWVQHRWLEEELARRYRDAAPATLALLQERCEGVAAELVAAESRLQAAEDVASLRKAGTVLHTLKRDTDMSADAATAPGMHTKRQQICFYIPTKQLCLCALLTFCMQFAMLLALPVVSDLILSKLHHAVTISSQ